MCGRFALTATPQEVADLFSLDEIDPFPPRFNIAPTQPVLMVNIDPANRRAATLVRWGLVPAWVKQPQDFTLLINARSETAAEKPSFRNAMRHRRTLIPASGFYEWFRPPNAKGNQKKQAYWIRPKDGGMVCFGGLMETWAGADGSEIDTGCILTTRANETIKEIHHRMPVVILQKDFDRWLDCKNTEPRDIVDLLQPVSNEYFEAIAVGDRVNKVANSGPDIQAPAEPNPDGANATTARTKTKRHEKNQLDLF